MPVDPDRARSSTRDAAPPSAGRPRARRRDRRRPPPPGHGRHAAPAGRLARAHRPASCADARVAVVGPRRRRRPGRPPAGVDRRGRPRSCSRDDRSRRALDEVGRVARASKARAERGPYRRPPEADVVVLATPAGPHGELGPRARRPGRPVVSDVRRDRRRRAPCSTSTRGRRPGRAARGRRRLLARATCVLAATPPTASTTVDEIHVARLGTGGPACARQHHRPWAARRSTGATAAGSAGPAGSGRELCWFPDPVGAADCYRAALPDALLLVPGLPGRRAGSPPAWPPPAATGSPPACPCCAGPTPRAGSARCGSRCGAAPTTASGVEVLGAMDRPGVAAGAVAALAAVELGAGRAPAGRCRRVWPSWSTPCRSWPSWPAGASRPPRFGERHASQRSADAAHAPVSWSSSHRVIGTSTPLHAGSWTIRRSSDSFRLRNAEPIRLIRGIFSSSAERERPKSGEHRTGHGDRTRRGR